MGVWAFFARKGMDHVLGSLASRSVFLNYFGCEEFWDQVGFITFG